MSQDTSVYGDYLSGPTTADPFLQSPPSLFGSTDPDLLSFMEELPTYESEAPNLTQGLFPAHDVYHFNSEPLFNLEQELMWGRFEESTFADPEFSFNSFTPGFSAELYTQGIPSQVCNSTLSTTSSSQTSLSHDFSPETPPESQSETVIGENSGKKRRMIGENAFSGETTQVLRKRVRGDQRSLPIPKGSNYLDRGYESMSSQTTSSSPQSDTGYTSKAGKGTEVVGNVARAIDGMIDKFSQSQVKLTKEEIEALRVAGLPIPTTLPLTKVEQHALRDVRRRLKNKQAAMENRKRKKEYVSDLEKKLVDYEKMVSSLEERMSRMEREKQALETEVKKLKRAGKREKENRPVSAQTGACLMVFILCFGLVFGTWFTGFGPLYGKTPGHKNPNAPVYSSFISRTLKGDDISQHTTFGWFIELLYQTGLDFLSLFNFTSDSTYFLISEESLLCQNHSCAPH